MPLLENVDDSAEQNFTKEIDKDDTNRANDIVQLRNELVADCVRLGYIEPKIDRPSEEPVDSSIDPSASNSVTQDQCSTGKNNFNYQTTEPNNVNSWHEQTVTLREWENINVSLGIPRFLVLCNRNNDCFIISALHLLINSPVFNQTIRSLDSVHSRFSTSYYGDLFDALFNVVTSAHNPYKNEETDYYNFKLLRNKCHIVKPNFKNGVQEDADEALLLFMNAVEEIATLKNEADSFSKKFYITCSVSTNNGVPVLEQHHAIRVLDTNLSFQQLIDQYFIGTVSEQTEDGQTIQRTYQALPDQLLVTCDRKQTGNAVHYSYPVEFTTRTGLHYQFTGAIIHYGKSINSGHYITLVRRQDYVYILDDQYVAGGFHITYLTDHLEKVHVRIIMYTQFNSSPQFSYEDPLHSLHLDELNNYVGNYFEKEKLTIFPVHDESKLSNVPSRMCMRHPIQSTFRYRNHIEYKKHNISNPKLEDCLVQKFFHFSYYSLFAGWYAECTLVVKGPDGQYYYATHEFYRDDDKTKKFENPTYFLIDGKASVGNEWFSLELFISKLIQRDALSYTHPEHGEIFHLERFPCGTTFDITNQVLTSFEKLNKTGKKKKNKRSENFTLLRVTETFNLRTLYLVIRLAKPNPDGNGFDTESEILFCSNGFTAVDSRHKVSEYDYSADKLEIEKLTPSQMISFDCFNKCVLQISCSIPEMYECTNLGDKLIEITLLAGDPEKKCSHPVYKMMNEESVVDSVYYLLTQNWSSKEEKGRLKRTSSYTFSITITKRTMAESQCDPNLLQILGITSVEDIQSMPQSTLQNILNSPGMASLRVQLQLCDFTNKKLTPYPRSIVVSDLLVEETVSSKEHIPIQLLETEREVLNSILAPHSRPTVISNALTDGSTASEEYTVLPSSGNGNLIENSIHESSLHAKRVFVKESNTRQRSPPSKCVKNSNTSCSDI